MKHSLRHLVAAILILQAATGVFADEVQTVEVVGSKIVQVPPSYTWMPAPVEPSVPLGEVWYQQHWARVKAANGVRDVRCVLANDLRTVTSHASVLDRWQAASAVYTTVSQAGAVIKDMVIGKVRNPVDGVTYSAYEVTYADGGTEKWLIFPEPRSSVKLFDDPLPGSLNPGDGQLKPSPWCGLG